MVKNETQLHKANRLKLQVQTALDGCRLLIFACIISYFASDLADKEGKDDCDVSEIIPKEVSTRNESERNKQLASKEKWMTPKKNSLHLPDEIRGVEEDSNNQTKEKSMVSKLNTINLK